MNVSLLIRRSWALCFIAALMLQAPVASARPHSSHIARAIRGMAAAGKPVVWHKVTPARQVGWRPRWWPVGLRTDRPVIVIRLRQQRLYLQDGRKKFMAFSVSTGAGRPTPRGFYQIVEKIRRPAWTYKGHHVPGGIPGNPLGVCWMGLGMPRWWTGAPIGMHGTNAPWVIGHPASHGCIRLRNEDALRLYRLVPVGCPVCIIP
jgi:lipoprotein-anchoring transpeptidase ErfK/SrfK